MYHVIIDSIYMHHGQWKNSLLILNKSITAVSRFTVLNRIDLLNKPRFSFNTKREAKEAINYYNENMVYRNKPIIISSCNVKRMMLELALDI